MANYKYPDHFIKKVVRRNKNTIDFIKQTPCQTFYQFMILNSKQLTPQGTQRLNDAIRTYVYCVLGAQAKTRTPIIDSFGTELDAQKVFRKLLEDSINQPADTQLRL
jgi:hypothetical protein